MLKSLTRKYAPAPVAQEARRWGSIARFWRQRRAARKRYEEYGGLYPHPLLFVAGLPKSGTTWMESMLSSYPGFEPLMIPEAVAHELDHGGSHDFDLSSDTFTRLDDVLAVLKLHVPGSAHNRRLLYEVGLPYVVMYRDPRDVAVSHYFYVRRTPWHPEYEAYAGLRPEEGVEHFGRTLLPAFVQWIREWRENRDPEQSIEVRYEDLLANSKEEFQAVAAHFGLDASDATVGRIVREHSFEQMSNGRSRGQHNANHFVRKGVTGDWRAYFSDEAKDVFKRYAGEALQEWGYEEDPSW